MYRRSQEKQTSPAHRAFPTWLGLVLEGLPRPIWSGTILVSVPVKMYSPTESKEPKFHFLHKGGPCKAS
jgi:hypothetical protein